ncbi:MAG TPA: hypothetical protein VFY38_04600 [Pseudonocardia sp.]|nr:hypothetical protein [Pseudonocardia sp.]
MSHSSGPPRPVDPRTLRGPSPEEAIDAALGQALAAGADGAREALGRA